MKIYLFELTVEGKVSKLFLSYEETQGVCLPSPSNKSGTFFPSKLGYFNAPFDDTISSEILFTGLLRNVLFAALQESGRIDLFSCADRNPLSTLSDIWIRLTATQKDQWLQFIQKTDPRFVARRYSPGNV